MRGQGQHTPSESACEPVLNEQPSLSGEYHFTYSPAEMLFNRHTPQVQGIISSRLNGTLPQCQAERGSQGVCRQQAWSEILQCKCARHSTHPT